MNDKWKSLIELVVNEEEDKAKDLFHEIAVDESRKIYENLIDEEDLADIDEASKEEKEEAVDEAKDEEVGEAEKTEESTEDKVEEASDEVVEETFSGDQTADLVADIKADEVGMKAEDEDGEDPEADAGDMADDMGLDGEEGEAKMDPEDAERMEDEILDLQTAIDDLKSEFENMTGDAPADDEEMPAEEPGMEPEMEPEMDIEPEEAVAFEGDEAKVEEKADAEAVDEDTTEKVVEYTQKAPAPVTSEGGEGKAGPVAGKNDMGGSAGNIAKGSSEEKGAKAAKPSVSDAGNKNKPGGKQSLSPAPKPKV